MSNKDEPVRVNAGELHGRRWDGRLERVAGGVPDLIVCRRIADFPAGRLPKGAAAGTCTRCAAPIAFNPARHHTAPFVCMQCEGIRPDPIV